MKDTITKNPVLRGIFLPVYRAKIMAGYLVPRCTNAVGWIFRSRETTNFTYDLTEQNKGYLSDTLSVVTGIPREEIRGYLREIEENQALRDHVSRATANSGLAYKADSEVRFHKRIGWYAMVRALKPKVVVETEVDKGLGSVVLCSALLLNRQEGHEGHYYGTDLNPKAGYLLRDTYAEVGEILYGDSVESLRDLEGTIDLFINDSDHSADYETLEYETVAGKLSPGAVILGDNSHATDRLMKFSHAAGRRFLFWREDPMNHWYPGGGIGFSWR